MPVQLVKLLDQINVTVVPGGIVPKGEYAAGTDYAVGDIVSYLGTSYVMYTNAAAGTAPTDTDYWQILAEKGETGAAGADGDAATITIGTVTTVAFGAGSTVTDVGDPGAAEFNFELESGEKGEKGDSSTITVGTVAAVAYGTPPTVTDVGAPGAAEFNFEFPMGQTGDDGDSSYCYIAYASAADGTDFTLTFDANLDYIAILTTDTAIPAPAVGDFAGLWKKYKGADGSDGEDGAVSGLRLWFDNSDSDMNLPTKVYTDLTWTNSGSNDYVETAGGNFVTDGWVAGRKLKVTGASVSGNNRTSSIKTVTASRITFTSAEVITSDSDAGISVTFASARETLTRLPVTGTEIDEGIALVLADGAVSIDNYCSVSGVPGVAAIPAGLWTLSGMFWVSAAGPRVTTVKFVVRTIAEDGTITEHGSPSSTATITATSNATATRLTMNWVNGADIPILTTDRLIIRVQFNANDSTSRTAHFIYQGTTRPAYLDTTFNVTAPKGEDGASAFVYIAYASADDGTDFTTTFNAALNYIAILSTDTEIVAPAVGDFAGLWKNYKGATGAAGAAGASGLNSKSFVITSPTAASDSPVWRAPVAITITAVHVLCVGGTNIVGQLWEYDANGANGAAVDSSDITATAGTNADDDGTLSNASVDAGDYVGWATTSVSGAVTKVIVTFEYSIPS